MNRILNRQAAKDAKSKFFVNGFITAWAEAHPTWFCGNRFRLIWDLIGMVGRFVSDGGTHVLP